MLIIALIFDDVSSGKLLNVSYLHLFSFAPALRSLQSYSVLIAFLNRAQVIFYHIICFQLCAFGNSYFNG